MRRSAWVIWLGPKSNDKRPYEKHTEKMTVMWRWSRDCGDVAESPGMAGQPPGAGRDKAFSPRGTVVLPMPWLHSSEYWFQASGLQNCGRVAVCGSKPPDSWVVYYSSHRKLTQPSKKTFHCGQSLKIFNIIDCRHLIVSSFRSTWLIYRNEVSERWWPPFLPLWMAMTAQSSLTTSFSLIAYSKREAVVEFLLRKTEQ